jgi:hypothetical protein
MHCYYAFLNQFAKDMARPQCFDKRNEVLARHLQMTRIGTTGWVFE